METAPVAGESPAMGAMKPHAAVKGSKHLSYERVQGTENISA